MSEIKATTTCQICGRPIKASAGTIAHHGYKRPGGGWQTSSCMGAKHLPYEQSCDLIPVAIKNVETWLSKQESMLADFMANPPAVIEQTRQYGSRPHTFSAELPAGFNPLTSYRTYVPKAYDTLFFARVYEFEQNIKHAKSDLEYLNKRLAEWIAPSK